MPAASVRPRRPALFASSFHPHIGGVEEAVRQLTQEHRRRGSSPVVLTNRYPKDLPARAVYEGQEVLRHPFRVPEPTLRQMGGWLVHGRRTQHQIDRQLRERACDLVHVQCVSSNGRYALGASRRLDLPLVVTMQGELTMDATDVYARSRQLRRTWRQLLDGAQAVTACSAHALREAERVYGKPFGARGRVVYNGIRPEDFIGQPKARRSRPYVLGLGRFVHQKGFDVLLRAFAQLGSAVRDVDLVLAGDGPARAELEKLADDLRLDGRVHFPGRVDHAGAVELLQGAEVFVLPSRHEPQGIVLLEAMAAGAPVLAHAVGGVPEVVKDGVNGLLYEGGPEQLAERLLPLVQHGKANSALAAAGRITATEFSWTAICDQYERVYDAAGR